MHKLYNKFKSDEFEYYDEAKDLPKFILTPTFIEDPISSDIELRNFNFKKGRVWKKIVHQTRGHGCGKIYMIGTELDVKPEYQVKANRLCRQWLYSDVGLFGVSLESINEYSDTIKQYFNTSCNFGHEFFREALYPLDITDSLIKDIISEEEYMPEDLDELLIFEDNWTSVVGCVNRWSLFILGENCD